MTTITLELPDELATRLNAWPEPLANLLSRALRQERASDVWQTAATHPAYQEMMDFLAERPTPQQIINFRFSALAQGRLTDLLEKNREEELDATETAELDVYELVHHSLIRLKAKARLRQK